MRYLRKVVHDFIVQLLSTVFCTGLCAISWRWLQLCVRCKSALPYLQCLLKSLLFFQGVANALPSATIVKTSAASSEDKSVFLCQLASWSWRFCLRKAALWMLGMLRALQLIMPSPLQCLCLKSTLEVIKQQKSAFISLICASHLLVLLHPDYCDISAECYSNNKSLFAVTREEKKKVWKHLSILSAASHVHVVPSLTS